jgi:hypothetical protein
MGLSCSTDYNRALYPITLVKRNARSRQFASSSLGCSYLSARFVRVFVSYKSYRKLFNCDRRGKKITTEGWEFGCKNDNFGFEKSNQTIRANLDKPKIAKELYEEFNVCWGSLLSGRPHWFLGKICQSVSNLKNQITFDKKC